MDAHALIVEWNRRPSAPSASRVTRALGRQLTELVIPERHRSSAEGQAADLPRAATGRRVELLAIHRQGHEFPIEMTISQTGGCGGRSGPRRFHAFMRDISDRKQSERVLLAMQAVTQAMARAESPEQAMSSVLRTLGESHGLADRCLLAP